MTGLTKSPQKIYGLVLAGGKSSRMGTDKGMIDWHGKGQRYHAADLLIQQCENVFISCRTGQQQEMSVNYAALPDQVVDCGPFGGVLSAFMRQPDVAWLVVACDLPMLDLQSITHLIQNRDDKSIATAYQSTADGLPEPMLVLWEPAAYPFLRAAYKSGNTSLRHLLMHSPVKLLTPDDPRVLTNVNTPEDVEALRIKSFL
jgi:molybdopterin-guanine dinucleotide biosynthesis protein A